MNYEKHWHKVPARTYPAWTKKEGLGPREDDLVSIWQQTRGESHEGGPFQKTIFSVEKGFGESLGGKTKRRREKGSQGKNSDKISSNRRGERRKPAKTCRKIHTSGETFAGPSTVKQGPAAGGENVKSNTPNRRYEEKKRGQLCFRHHRKSWCRKASKERRKTPWEILKKWSQMSKGERGVREIEFGRGHRLQEQRKCQPRGRHPKKVGIPSPKRMGKHRR